MVSELVKELRKYAKGFKNSPYGREIVGTEKLLIQAADTIEELSAKVARQSMERSSQYYGGGWIPCSERLPKLGEPVLVSDKQGNVCIRAITSEIKGKKYWSQDKCDIIAWQPLPTAFEPKEDKDEVN